MSDSQTASLTLLLVLHNHQPVGNLPEVFRSTYDSAYRPLVDLLERHPTVRAALHYTGPLLEWLESEEPAFLHQVAALQRSGQVELLGGGLYEPILAVIPDEDKVGQLMALSTRMQGVFGSRPTGAWLAERVWEPHLPRYFARAGLDYTILDQEHFEKAGLSPDEVDGAWLTEDVGEKVALFPGSTDLRYLVPWRSVDEVMAFLRRRQEAGQSLLVFADDGEKLGGWPGTYRHCYEEGWLERFCLALERNADWLSTSTPSRYLAQRPPKGRVYIPSATYPEMEDWSLPPSIQQQVRALREGAVRAGLETRFVRPGHWRGFLTRYAESSLMLQRSIAISRLAHALPPGARKQQALDQLWRGQCNCPYWHGVFGGIYLYHIRHATFTHLVAADALAVDEARPRERFEFTDVDADGRDECRLTTADQSVFLKTMGGALFEWDLPAVPINLLNTLADYHEAYSAEGTLTRPARPRHAFVDHLLAATPDLEDVSEDRWPEAIHLSDRHYHLAADAADGAVRATATCSALEGEEWGRLYKSFTVEAGSPALRVRYALTEGQSLTAGSCLAIEISLALPPGAHTLGRLGHAGNEWSLAEATELADVDRLRLDTPRLAVEIECDRRARVIVHPLWSRHRTELGEEKVYQGTRLVLLWPLGAAAQTAWEAGVEVRWSLAPEP